MFSGFRYLVSCLESPALKLTCFYEELLYSRRGLFSASPGTPRMVPGKGDGVDGMTTLGAHQGNGSEGNSACDW